MVWKLECDCNERIGIEVDSIKIFKELKIFFDTQAEMGIFIEEKNKEPFYVWKNGKEEKKWYATKWYRCQQCGCLWEFDYPDFPTQGFVRKFENGIYYKKE